MGQLASLRSRFTNYEQYSDATIHDILDKEQIASAGKLRANNMKTALFLSSDDNRYKSAPLPIQVQYAPIFSIAIADFNGDDKTDIALFGNNHHFKLRLGKFDANYGVLLAGDGQGTFQYKDQLQSGLNVKGAVHSTIQIDDLLILGIQGKPVKAYRILASE